METKGIEKFLILSFLEGSAVMATELLGAKMMAPYFGSSLYVWSSVMAITLLGLAAGYFIGGIWSEKEKKEINLYKVLVLAALFTIIMPYLAKGAFLLFGKMSLEISVTISSIIILLPPVFFMGMVSPIIISIISKNTTPGRASGTVYAISTVGGIISTFLFGFYIIPSLGLTWPSLLTGIVLGIYPLIQLLKNKTGIGQSALLVLFFSLTLYRSIQEKPEGAIKIIYTSEGILGQIIVLDFPLERYTNNEKDKGKYSRWLYVNRISQTTDDPSAIERGDERYFTYVYHIEKLLDTLPKSRRKVLLLGLGGGSVAKHLTEKGFEVEVCELDARMEYVARTYFGLPEKVKVTIDDARHYINTNEKKYDVVIFDTFKGEEAPSHVFTSESLSKVKSFLDDNGMIIVNTFGFLDGEEGLGARSIWKTLLSTDFNTVAWPTSDKPYERNIEFVALKNRNHSLHNENFIYAEDVDLNNAFVLEDEYPIFELINAKAALIWRSMAVDVYNTDPTQRSVPLFY